MYSPDISQHSPWLYRLGRHYDVPMTVLADRLIFFGLQRLAEVMPDKAPPEASMLQCAAEPVASCNIVPRTRKAA